MTTPEAPNTLGIIELPALADALTSVGVRVVSGQDYRTAATAIRAGLEEGSSFPIVVLDAPRPGLRAWVDKQARDTTVLVLRGDSGNGTVFTGVRELVLPVTVGEALALAGGPVLDETVASRTILTDGTLTGSATSTAPAPAHRVEPSPVLDHPTPTAPAAVDPWEAQQAARGTGPSVPPPPSVFAPPMPAVPRPPAPLAPAPEPAPATALDQPAPAAVDPWEAQTAPTFVTPAPALSDYQAPVAPTPADEDPVTDEPVVEDYAYYRQPETTPEAYEPSDSAPFDDADYDEPPATLSYLEDSHDVQGRQVESLVGMTTAVAPTGPQCDAIVVWGAKGGVGKSTFAFGLAQRAAKAGLRVVLIDANFGQGDLRFFLRLNSASLPSIYQYAVSADLKQTLIDPDSLNGARSPKLSPLDFALVQAPPPSLADPAVVTPATYARLVAEARAIADLVIIDTQIIEAVDFSGMVDGLVTPLLRDGAWGLGVSELSPASVGNLLSRLTGMDGIAAERQMTTINRAPQVNVDINGVASALNEHSTFLGTVFYDEVIYEHMNHGYSISDLPVIAPVLDAALAHVTGDQRFANLATPALAAVPATQATGGQHAAPASGAISGLLSRIRRSRAA